MKGATILQRLILWVNAFVALLLGAANTAPFISPDAFILPAFFGLTFLPLLIVNVLCLFFWFAIKPKYALVSGLFIFISLPNLNRHVNLFGSSASEGDGFSVMSFNVRLFDLYNWTDNKSTRNNIFDYIVEKNTDILCFQEHFNTSQPRYFITLDTLTRIQPANAVHEEFTAILHEGKHKFGIATLSRYPVIKRGRVPIDNAHHNIAIYTDVLIDSDTVRIFNLHLASVHLSAIEDEISEHIERNERQKQWDDLKETLGRLAGGYKRRALQADEIASYIRDSPYPVIVCGDINDTPGSYAYAVLSEGLNDAFCEQGSWLGSTYVGFFPSLRIDFLFFDPSLELLEFSTEQVELSDHRPLWAKFRFSEKS